MERLHDLYSSPNVTRVIKSRTRWAGHVALMGQKRYGFCWKNLNIRIHAEDLGVVERILLN
jgi:hypothetical protein